MSAWQRDGQFDTVEVMPVEQKRKALMDYAFDGPEIEDLLNDPRLNALAQIKLQNKEEQDLEEEKS